MVDVELRIPDPEGHYEPVARLRVDATGTHLSGRGELFDTAVAVFDRRAGRHVRFDEDPEAWARNLDTAYRTGQLVPVVIADSDPNPPPERAPRPAIELPDRATR